MTVLRQTAQRGLAIAAFALALGGCTTSGLLCGGEPATGSGARHIRWEACKARHGDKEYQYQIGRRYWEGDGLPHDRAEAVKWLSRAAEPVESSRTYVYVPPVGSRKFGTVQGFDMPGEPGHPEARRLLEKIRSEPSPEAGEPR